MTELLAREDATVVAVVRQSSRTDVLQALPKAKGARLLTVAIDASDFVGSKSIITSFAKDNAIPSIDVVIASAGGAYLFSCCRPHHAFTHQSCSLNCFSQSHAAIRGRNVGGSSAL